MDKLIKGLCDACEMDRKKATFENYLYIYSAKSKVSIELEDGKVTKIKNERINAQSCDL